VSALQYERVVLGFALVSAALLPKARADDLSRSDKLHALYSNQFSFDRRGIPMISIGIIEGTDQVTLQSKGPITVLPDGEGGAEVTGANRWQVRLRASRPALVHHYLVLARTPVGQLETLRTEQKRWRARRVETKVIEVGAIFGTQGRVFDNRAFIVCDGPHTSEAAAERRGRSFVERGWIPRARVVAQLERRPSGSIEVLDPRSKTRIRAADAIWFAPQNERELLSVQSAVNRSGPFSGQLGGNYRGQLYVTIDRRGKLAVVNSLPADQLLAGLVSAEIFPSAPPAALRAQAIAARGNVLTQIGTKNLADPYLTCAWVRCQVYRGAGHEYASTTRAVEQTRGLVLMRNAGGLVDAVYHAHCGGHTEDNESIWPGTPDPALRAKLDASGSAGSLAPFRAGITTANLGRWLALTPPSWCAKTERNRKRLRWRATRTSSQLSTLLAKLRVGRVKRIEVAERGRSGRAKQVRVYGTKGAASLHRDLPIRLAFGRLNSSAFIVRPVGPDAANPKAFEFVGAGWGHGVGMCQTGAIGMAESGKSHEAILQHYYSDSEVQRIY
jgi:stage II sporulation protein D